MLISLSGQRRVGKDTVADILVSKFKFTKIALADPLRDLCSRVFNIPLETFLSDELKEKAFDIPVQLTNEKIIDIIAIVEHEWGFKVDDFQYDRMLEFAGVTFANPRQILQLVGTEIIRGSIDDNIFLTLADNRIKSIGKNIVISDVRFEVEQQWAKERADKMVLIKRPNLNLKQDTHRSENELTNEEIYDTIMLNDADLGRFKIEVIEYFNEIMRKRSQ